PHTAPNLFPYTTPFRSGAVAKGSRTRESRSRRRRLRDEAGAGNVSVGCRPYGLSAVIVRNTYSVRSRSRPAAASPLALCPGLGIDRKSTRLNSSHLGIS